MGENKTEKTEVREAEVTGHRSESDEEGWP